MLKVTCAIIILNKKVLITQNGEKSNHPFQWEFPGGKIKQNETAEECIIREIEEELELKISIVQELESVEFDYGIKKIELIPFYCSISEGKIVLNEHVDFRWISGNELKNIDFSGADQELLHLETNRNFLKKYIGE